METDTQYKKATKTILEYAGLGLPERQQRQPVTEAEGIRPEEKVLTGEQTQKGPQLTEDATQPTCRETDNMISHEVAGTQSAANKTEPRQTHQRGAGQKWNQRKHQQRARPLSAHEQTPIGMSEQCLNSAQSVNKG